MWVRDAYLSPVQRLGLGYVRAGVYAPGGRHLAAWPLFASKDSVFNRPQRRLTAPAGAYRLEAPTIYGGAFYPGFCHFLTETLPNLIALGPARAAYPEARIVMHAPEPVDLPRVARTAHGAFFFGLLGVDPGRIDLVTRPLVATDLFLPEPAFATGLRPAPHLPALVDAAFATIVPEGPEQVYFSRLRWTRKGDRVIGEARVQAQFAEAGYTPVHMQELPLHEQLALARAAVRIAGPQGTALHWSLFGPKTRGVICLGWRSRLQEGICAVRGQHYRNLKGLPPNPFRPRARRLAEATIAKCLRREV